VFSREFFDREKNLNVETNSNLGKPIIFFFFVFVILKRKKKKSSDGRYKTQVIVLPIQKVL